ncbi:26S proteasome non-ATPase regulatory subunit 3-like isoform X2 [Physella acuta]|uniref:26S proteasome non-ATPase regulatory subunit 3-like isoform X2 n=1 Tax=Physella acuta TaxID=109671 RepID=UPI0027DD193D|nr:26S proteasome non-ATPase regulatory subunit 3-like isoform X2 [Physella acuta]
MVKVAETQDVEMKDASANDANKTEETEKEEKKDPELLTLEDIREHVRHIEKAVSTKEPRFMSRVIRALVSVRRKLNPRILRSLMKGYFTAPNVTNKEELLPFLADGQSEGMNGISGVFRPRSGKLAQTPVLPEVEIYIHLLVLIYLIDTKQYERAVECSELLMKKLIVQNRRTMDMLSAKCYFYYSRSYELTNKLEIIRTFLHARLRTATLRSDHEGQATLINLLLRNYLHYSLFEQADKLVSKSTFPDSASNNEWARYLFYLGRIKAAQLEYSEAHKHLLQATRKAPQQSAIGFKQTVQKLAITVELLLGDIPDRTVFRQQSMRRTLAPYFQLTQAVRGGNLQKFNETLAKFGTKFQAENTYTLIVRLRHNVIKTGVRMISLSYSRIYLSDIAQRLTLDSPEDAEFIVAKAIRDGVIEATIDHENGYVQSKETGDVYSTKEPMTAFHQRISFCLDIHNQSVKAMRFPPKSYNKDLESAEERREREQQELESAKEIAEEDFDGFP